MATINFEYCFSTKVNYELLVNQSVALLQFHGSVGGGRGDKRQFRSIHTRHLNILGDWLRAESHLGTQTGFYLDHTSI